MNSTQFSSIVIWVFGGIICAATNHPEFGGLGLMIVGACYRIAWQMEDNKIV